MASPDLVCGLVTAVQTLDQGVRQSRQCPTVIVDDFVEKQSVFVQIAEELFRCFGISDGRVLLSLYDRLLLL